MHIAFSFCCNHRVAALVLMTALFAHATLTLPISAQAGILSNVVHPPPFRCATFTNASSPTSVHKLRVSDIRVIGAMGDSLSAGFQAEGVAADDYREWRGLSWSAGGDNGLATTITLPNILKQYSPSLTGMSFGLGMDQTNLNAAISGAVSQDLLSQAIAFVNRLRDPTQGVDYNADWKMVTIFIGVNNLCRYCKDPNFHDPSQYEAGIRNALSHLLQVPRLVVNLASVLEVSQFYGFVDEQLYPSCREYITPICSCGISSVASEREVIRRLHESYTAILKRISQDSRYQRDDFAVVYQPLYESTSIPQDPSTGKPVVAYFSPDCFHFQTVMHEGLAVALWNNIWSASHAKSTKWIPGEQYICPSQEQVICTQANERAGESRCVAL